MSKLDQEELEIVEAFEAGEYTSVENAEEILQRHQEYALYERARRFANFAMWTIDMQFHRLNSQEPMDSNFVLRKIADFHFFIIALYKLRRSAELAKKVKSIGKEITIAINQFDHEIPNLKLMRDAAEHFDDYAEDNGKNKNINRKQLEVDIIRGDKWTWLGIEIDTKKALGAGTRLFQAINNYQSQLTTTALSPL